MEILVYEMQYNGDKVASYVKLSLFEENYYDIYKTIYNECFYEMRKVVFVISFMFYLFLLLSTLYLRPLGRVVSPG